MRLARWVATLALLMALVVSASGALAAPQRVINYGIFEDPSTINVFAQLGPQATVWNSYVGYGVWYATLFANAPPRFDLVPNMAADYPTELKQEKVGNETFWTSIVKLRGGLRWADGTAVSADDVVFTYETILKFDPDKLGGNWPSQVPKDVLARVEKLGDYAVKFYLKKKPGLANWQYGLMQTLIVQRKTWEPIVQQALASEDPVQSLLKAEVTPEAIGAYKYGRWEKGAFFENVANPNSSFRGDTTTFYKNGAVALSNDRLGLEWATKDPAPQGDVQLSYTEGPYADAVLYRIYQNQNAAVLALINGDVDYVINSLGLQRGFQEQLAKAPNVEIVRNNTNGFRYLTFNIRRAPFSYTAFRQAVATLIDREFVTKSVLQGVAFPLATTVPPGNSYWYNPDVKVWGQGMTRGERVQAATELLKQAGFSWRKEPVVRDAAKDDYDPGEGLILPDGKPVQPFDMLAPAPGYDPLRSTFALWIERWMRELGIPVRAKLTDFNFISTKMFEEQDFDMSMLGWSLTLFPDHLFWFFHSSQAGIGGFNAEGYNNPEFDKVAQALLDASTMDEARDLAFKAQEFLADEVPYIVLFDTPVMEAYRSDRLQFPFTESLGGFQFVYGVPALVKLAR